MNKVSALIDAPMIDCVKMVRVGEKGRRLYSIGHGNIPIEKFVSLLTGFEIDLLADVRSQPFSRFSPHFNRHAIEESLRMAGVEYIFMGNRLGGRPRDESFYKLDGEVDYDALSRSPSFVSGVDELLEAAGSRRVAFMCAEADFRRCHRYKLITPVLIQTGAEVVHIKHSGESESSDRSEFKPLERSLF